MALPVEPKMMQQQKKIINSLPWMCTGCFCHEIPSQAKSLRIVVYCCFSFSISLNLIETMMCVSGENYQSVYHKKFVSNYTKR